MKHWSRTVANSGDQDVFFAANYDQSRNLWGKPCIRGLRFPVSRLFGLLAAGETSETILRAYPYLEPEDIQEALCYAAFLADEQAA